MMRIYDNGIYRDMTAEEIAEYERRIAEMPQPEPLPDDRFSIIESALLELGAMLGGGV